MADEVKENVETTDDGVDIIAVEVGIIVVTMPYFAMRYSIAIQYRDTVSRYLGNGEILIAMLLNCCCCRLLSRSQILSQQQVEGRIVRLV